MWPCPLREGGAGIGGGGQAAIVGCAVAAGRWRRRVAMPTAPTPTSATVAPPAPITTYSALATPVLRVDALPVGCQPPAGAGPGPGTRPC